MTSQLRLQPKRIATDKPLAVALMDTMAAGLALPIALDSALGLIIEHLGLSSAAIYLQQDILTLAAHRSADGIDWPAELQEHADSQLADAGLTRLDAQQCQQLGLARIAQSETAALITASLTTGSKSLGLIVLVAGQDVALDSRPWDDLELCARMLGLSISHALLDQQLGRQIRESQTVYKVSRAFVATPELDSLLNLIVHSAVDTIVKAKNCVLHLYDDETDTLRARALSFVGRIRQSPSGSKGMRLGEGVAGTALETARLINVPDVSHDARFVTSVSDTRSFAAMMVAPLRMGERRIGTLSVDSDTTNAFSEEDERLLMTLASQASAAIENARLVRDLQHSLDDLKRTQAQLIQSEKLSAIGQLIAGVAHELNNPLTAVMGYTQLLRTEDRIDTETRTDLDKIYGQAQRAAKIVENLLTFARQQKAEKQVVDINDVLDRTLELRAYQLQVENISLIKHFEQGPLTVAADPNQLQQVFLNLINNAQDAMVEHRGGGHLVVESSIVEDKVHIRFTDNGPGLSDEARQHLFEPFFTTKEVGKGTGLGLSICFGIVSQYGGSIWVEQSPEGGASFVVMLPNVAQAPTAMPDADRTVSTVARCKRILIVDDEAEVAEVLTRILLHDKHRVSTAQDGAAALTYLMEAQDKGMPFDLVISDIKMPGLGGAELYERMRQDLPEMLDHIIYITGDTMSPATHSFLEETDVPFLTKPFKINELRQLTDLLLS